jgi:hypothetical protein
MHKSLYRNKCRFRFEVTGLFLVNCGCAVTFPVLWGFDSSGSLRPKPRRRRFERKSEGGGTFGEAGTVGRHASWLNDLGLKHAGPLSFEGGH